MATGGALDGALPPLGWDLDGVITCPGNPSCVQMAGTKENCDDSKGREGALEATRFNLLRSIMPMPRLRSFPSSAMRSASAKPVPAPKPTATTPLTSERVAIFDAGVRETLPQFAPFVQQFHLTNVAPDDDGVAHRTAVTSAFLYGHLAPGKQLERPVAYVDHYRVYPPPKSPKYDENLYWVLDRIEDVAKQGRHRFINLSFAPDIVIDDAHEPHRWTSSL